MVRWKSVADSYRKRREMKGSWAKIRINRPMIKMVTLATESWEEIKRQSQTSRKT